MEQTPYCYQITYYSTESKQSTIFPDSGQNKTVISGLKPYTKYTVSITCKLEDGAMSEDIGKVFLTGENYLKKKQRHILQEQLKNI